MRAEFRATWPESVDEALCVGWIDGVRRRIDDRSTFARCEERRSATYSYEERDRAALSPAEMRQLRANRASLEFFSAQPAGYRQKCRWWIMSAKRPETHARGVSRA